jgi:hypothetical protein
MEEERRQFLGASVGSPEADRLRYARTDARCVRGFRSISDLSGMDALRQLDDGQRIAR